jgi:hypothetical protein
VDQSLEIRSSFLQVKEPAELDTKVGSLKEGMSENSAFPSIDQHVGGNGANNKSVLRGARDTDKDAQNAESSGSDTSSAKGNNVLNHANNGDSKSMERLSKVVVDETLEEEKVEHLQRRKRKRTIMNDKTVELMERSLLDEPENEKAEPLQKRKRRTIMNDKMVELMERALLDEPDMQRNAASLQSWADKLSEHVCKLS